MNKIFPENYPRCLEAVSWCIAIKDDEMLFGIYTRYNKHLRTPIGNPYFVQNMMRKYVLDTYFKSSQTLPREVISLIKYICDCITVKWVDEEFVVNSKKIKKDDRYIQKFDPKEYKKLSDACLIDFKDALTLMKCCLRHIRDEYNTITMRCFKNKQKFSEDVLNFHK